MKNNWKKDSLEAVCIKITDGSHSSPASVESGLPMGSVKDMNRFGINLNTCRKISELDFNKLLKQDCKPLIGDVLIAKDGATALDTVCEIKKEINVVLLSSVAILRPNTSIIYPSFLRYYLDCEDTRNYMKGSFITGAAIPRVVLKDFKKSNIYLPPLPIQKKIADILSAYDALIENNTRRIAILEEMAETLYREWFVEWKTPGVKLRKATPLEKKFTGKDVFPDGWEVKKLGEVCELLYGKALKAENRVKGDYPVYGSGGIIGYHNEYSVNSPGIIVGRKGNVGSIFWSNKNFFVIDTAYFIKSNVSLYYLFYNLKNQNFINNDAAVPGLSRNQAYSNLTITPDKPVITEFEHSIKPIFEQIENLHKQNQTLRATRDLLLPKLMSGELDVEEL